MAKENEGAEQETQAGLQPVPNLPEAQGEEGEDTTNWQEVANKQHEAAKQYEGLAKRNKSDLDELKQDPRLQEKPAESNKENEGGDNKPEQTGPDYGRLAYLNSMGIPSEDHEWVTERANALGLELNEVLQKDWVKNELNSRKEERQSKEAIPEGSQRSAASSRDDVEYWISKGELPPKDGTEKATELRRKVIGERKKRSQSGKKFSDQAVV